GRDASARGATELRSRYPQARSATGRRPCADGTLAAPSPLSRFAGQPVVAQPVTRAAAGLPRILSCTSTELHWAVTCRHRSRHALRQRLAIALDAPGQTPAGTNGRGPAAAGRQVSAEQTWQRSTASRKRSGG